MQEILVLASFFCACLFIGRKLYLEYLGKGGHCGDCDMNSIHNNTHRTKK